MSKFKNKEVSSYVVAQRGGMSDGRCIRFKEVFRVGARSEKEALAFCRSKIDTTAGFTVLRLESNRTLPKGMVVTYEPAVPEPSL